MIKGRPIIYSFCQGLCRIIASVVFDMKAYGTKNVPETGGCLIVSNHESFLDPALIGVQIFRPISYMAKSELFEVPVFGWIIRQCKAFPVRQGKGDKAAIEETIRQLQSGNLLNIFPEGSRTEDGNLQPIQKGVALIIRRANVPILPVVIDGSFQAWPRGRKLPRAHPVRVLYGKPVDVSHMKGDQIVQFIDQTFRSMLKELRAKD